MNHEEGARHTAETNIQHRADRYCTCAIFNVHAACGTCLQTLHALLTTGAYPASRLRLHWPRLLPSLLPPCLCLLATARKFSPSGLGGYHVPGAGFQEDEGWRREDKTACLQFWGFICIYALGYNFLSRWLVMELRHQLKQTYKIKRTKTPPFSSFEKEGSCKSGVRPTVTARSPFTTTITHSVLKHWPLLTLFFQFGGLSCLRELGEVDVCVKVCCVASLSAGARLLFLMEIPDKFQ